MRFSFESQYLTRLCSGLWDSGSNNSWVSGHLLAGSRANKRCRNVVPVRGRPITTMGARGIY